MIESKIKSFIETVLENMPSDWLELTTHRLDIYKEDQAKVQFLNELEKLFLAKDCNKEALKGLPTAYDYIRLGHPLSCLLEWAIAKSNNLNHENVISFSSEVMPILAVLRKNLLEGINTQIVYNEHSEFINNTEVIKNVYGYNFDLVKVNSFEEISEFAGSTIALSKSSETLNAKLNSNVDFLISSYERLGSLVLISAENSSYISEIQHVRRRESIAMTPTSCLNFLKGSTGIIKNNKENKKIVLDIIKDVTNTNSEACIGSSGLSIQYAIMMGLIDHSMQEHAGKDIKFIVPPNCYGGTNDQARRVAACLSNVEIMDLPVDGDDDMVKSIVKVLDQVADQDAIPFIIAEIPTNPRVEVPGMDNLREALSTKRKTSNGENAIAPVFILDQTFCPNIKFLGERDFLSSVKTISYVSGSKFPSGGKCTAGYCVANKKSEELMSYISNHLKICSNEATDFQIEVLAKQMPSMNERIGAAYKQTREFVSFIMKVLPAAKINFVSEELASDGFTPSVFSLDLPTKGETSKEKETYKRELNLKLINMMINEIPNESKHCVSYGQLKGCYWTIPATSTQGTTKEGDKDYIVRVAVSPNLDLDLHKDVFARFCKEYM